MLGCLLEDEDGDLFFSLELELVLFVLGLNSRLEAAGQQIENFKKELMTERNRL